MKKVTGILLILLLTMTSFNQPQAAAQSFDYERMNQDLSVMEKILQTLVKEKDIRDYIRISRIKGAFVPDYGVVFMMSASTRTYRDEKAQSAADGFDRLKEELNSFLMDYAGVIKQLDGNDWITIVANAGSSDSFDFPLYVFEGDRLSSFRAHPFMMTVKKSDVNRARSSNQSVAQFSNSVKFTSLSPDNAEYLSEAMNRDIKVMRSIFETSLETRLGADFDGDRFQGTYLEGYGVLFLVNSGDVVRIAMPDREVFFVEPGIAVASGSGAVELRVDDLQERIAIANNEFFITTKKKYDEDDKKRKQEDQERTQRVINALTEVIGDYGHTLRDLDPNEKIGVLYTSSKSYWGTKRGKLNLMLTVSYKDIQDYSGGRISLDQFKERVSAKTFE